jgi:hypothetical protein
MQRHKFITVRLSESERDQLLKMAREWGVQRSEVLRFCLRVVLLQDPNKIFNEVACFPKD